MIYSFFTDPLHVLLFLKFFISVSLLLSSIQHLINIKQFSESGLLPWSILRKRKSFYAFNTFLFDRLYNKNGFCWLNILRVIIVLLFIIDFKEINFYLLIAVSLITFLIYLRTGLMNNAADQVNNIALTGLILNAIFRSINTDNIIIYFFSVLLIISYFTSGLLKINEIKWRSGYYLKRVLIMRSHHNENDGGFFQKIDNNYYQIFSQITITWQLISVLAPLFPYYILIGYVIIALFFHIATGIFMGLQNFIFTFTAFLPALIFLNHKVLLAI